MGIVNALLIDQNIILFDINSFPGDSGAPITIFD
jgi:hypothetical protein